MTWGARRGTLRAERACDKALSGACHGAAGAAVSAAHTADAAKCSGLQRGMLLGQYMQASGRSATRHHRAMAWRLTPPAHRQQRAVVGSCLKPTGMPSAKLEKRSTAAPKGRMCVSTGAWDQARGYSSTPHL